MICDYDAILEKLGTVICSGDVTYELTVEHEGEEPMLFTLCSEAAQDVERMMVRDREAGREVPKTLRRIEAANDAG